MEKEPKHRNGIKGKYLLKMAGVIVTVVSFDTKKDAEAWGSWNDFGKPNPYEIILNPKEVK